MASANTNNRDSRKRPAAPDEVPGHSTHRQLSRTSEIDDGQQFEEFHRSWLQTFRDNLRPAVDRAPVLPRRVAPNTVSSFNFARNNSGASKGENFVMARGNVSSNDSHSASLNTSSKSEGPTIMPDGGSPGLRNIDEMPSPPHLERRTLAQNSIPEPMRETGSQSVGHGIHHDGRSDPIPNVNEDSPSHSLQRPQLAQRPSPKPSQEAEARDVESISTAPAETPTQTVGNSPQIEQSSVDVSLPIQNPVNERPSNGETQDPVLPSVTNDQQVSQNRLQQALACIKAEIGIKDEPPTDSQSNANNIQHEQYEIPTIRQTPRVNNENIPPSDYWPSQVQTSIYPNVFERYPLIERNLGMRTSYAPEVQCRPPIPRGTYNRPRFPVIIPGKRMVRPLHSVPITLPANQNPAPSASSQGHWTNQILMANASVSGHVTNQNPSTSTSSTSRPRGRPRKPNSSERGPSNARRNEFEPSTSASVRNTPVNSAMSMFNANFKMMPVRMPPPPLPQRISRIAKKHCSEKMDLLEKVYQINPAPTGQQFTIVSDICEIPQADVFKYYNERRRSSYEDVPMAPSFEKEQTKSPEPSKEAENVSSAPPTSNSTSNQNGVNNYLMCVLIALKGAVLSDLQAEMVQFRREMRMLVDSAKVVPTAPLEEGTEVLRDLFPKKFADKKATSSATFSTNPESSTLTSDAVPSSSPQRDVYEEAASIVKRTEDIWHIMKNFGDILAKGDPKTPDEGSAKQ